MIDTFDKVVQISLNISLLLAFLGGWIHMLFATREARKARVISAAATQRIETNLQRVEISTNSMHDAIVKASRLEGINIGLATAAAAAGPPEGAKAP